MDGVTARQYLVDESGSVVELVIPTGVNAGTYLVTYNGHGDAQATWRIKTDGSLELANSFSYATWGAPTITSSHPNSANGGAAYPDRSEANLYAYAANNPVTEIDPDGTCFIVCQLVVGAIIDTVVYLATEDNANLGGLVSAVAGGAVESAINPLGKINKIAKLAKAATKIYSKHELSNVVVIPRGVAPLDVRGYPVLHEFACPLGVCGVEGGLALAGVRVAVLRRSRRFRPRMWTLGESAIRRPPGTTLEANGLRDLAGLAEWASIIPRRRGNRNLIAD